MGDVPECTTDGVPIDILSKEFFDKVRIQIVEVSVQVFARKI